MYLIYFLYGLSFPIKKKTYKNIKMQTRYEKKISQGLTLAIRCFRVGDLLTFFSYSLNKMNVYFIIIHLIEFTLNIFLDIKSP